MGACSNMEVPKAERSLSTVGSTLGASLLTLKDNKEFEKRYRSQENAKGARLMYVRDKETDGEYVCRRLDRASMPSKQPSAISTHLQALNGLEHPHLCKFVEAFENDENLYLIYEKADATTLFRYIQGGQTFLEDDAAEYTRQIAMALSVSHEQGLMHGRLNPSKVLIAPQEEDEDEPYSDEEELPVENLRPWARFDLEEKYNVANTGVAAGSGAEPRREVIECMPPEVAWDEVEGAESGEIRQQAFKMDIWSLGCIVYHMLTGVPPHRAASTEALVERVKSQTVEFREEWDILSSEARDATERMLMVNAGLRPSAAAMLRHPWLRLRRESVSKARILRLLGNIRINASEGHFKRMVMRVVAQQLPAESREITSIERAFRYFDRNGDGVLGVDEIIAGIKKLDILDEKETEDFKDQLALLDRDGSQTVNLQEFVAGSLNAKRALSNTNLWHAFNAFDRDRNGNVSINEVEEIVRKVEAGLLAKDQVDGIVRRTRRELESSLNSNEMDFSQFVYIMSTPSGKPDASLAMQRDVYSVAHACLGFDCYKVRKVEPKRWNWQQASRSPNSAYRRASLVVPGRKYSKGNTDGRAESKATTATTESDRRPSRGTQPRQQK
eukprot:CAMPEP_0169415914 /NCGR_PEP_ID=MMETSP1017-20121227/62832_1 /TAXON_ID=342587 /ORGANISM="Karlodinium micrum, Strain CCMP2283" /LENGTH=613 /DNA_ID=CAMNT_0009523805 /DNA_START=1 /DNA_END=1843 /DNA_ORIENTATION=-